MTYSKKYKTRTRTQTRRRRRSKGGESWFRKVFSQNKTQNKVPPPPPPPPPPKQQIHNWNNGAEEIRQKYGNYGENIYGTQGQYRVHAFDHDGIQGIRDSDAFYDDDIAKKNGTYHYSKKSQRVTANKYKGQQRVPDLKPKEYRRSIYPKTTPSPTSQLFLYSSPKKKESPQTPSPFAREKRSMPKWVKDDIERGEYRMDS